MMRKLWWWCFIFFWNSFETESSNIIVGGRLTYEFDGSLVIYHIPRYPSTENYADDRDTLRISGGFMTEYPRVGRRLRGRIAVRIISVGQTCWRVYSGFNFRGQSQLVRYGTSGNSTECLISLGRNRSTMILFFFSWTKIHPKVGQESCLLIVIAVYKQNKIWSNCNCFESYD